MVAPSSTVITNLSRKAMSAITGLMLFTVKRANAIQTLLDMTAASASLATMAMTGHRKKPSADENDQYLYINMSSYCISNYVVTLTAYIWRDQQNRHGQPRPNSTLSQHQQLWHGRVELLEATFSHITWHEEILTLRMTCRGFLRGIDCIIQ